MAFRNLLLLPSWYRREALNRTFRNAYYSARLYIDPADVTQIRCHSDRLRFQTLKIPQKYRRQFAVTRSQRSIATRVLGARCFLGFDFDKPIRNVPSFAANYFLIAA